MLPDHACALVVAVAAMALPSTVKCTTVLARPDPVNASLEVIRSVVEAPVSRTIKPPIMTLSPVWIKPRVEIFAT